MELVNEWLPTGNFRKVYTPFRSDSTHKKDLMDELSLPGHALYKAEMEYHEKNGHTLVRIQHIALMIRMEIFYATYCLGTQNVALNLPDFQGINLCVQYLASHPHKPIFYPYNYYDGSNVIILT